MAVGVEEGIAVEVATDGQKTIGVTQGAARVGKLRMQRVQKGQAERVVAQIVTCKSDEAGYAWSSRYFSASSAAMQPEPAEVIAWR